MSQPGRYLHLLEPLAQPVTIREFDAWREQDAPPHADITGRDVLATFVCFSGRVWP